MHGFANICICSVQMNKFMLDKRIFVKNLF